MRKDSSGRKNEAKSNTGSNRGMNAKTPFAFAFLVLIAAAAIALPAAGPAPPAARKGGLNPLDDLARLCRDGRYFELRDAVARLDADPSPALDFYRGAVDVSFNRLEPAVAHLLGYLGGAPGRSSPPLARAARLLLADAYRRLGRYRDSAEMMRTILDRNGSSLNSGERLSLRNQLQLWSALSEVPPQTVEIRGDSDVPMSGRHIPVNAMGRTLSLGYDTGSSLSVLFRSAADDLGLPLFEPAFRIQSVTGKWIEARAAVVPELRFGEVTVRNAVFLVFPDSFFAPGRFYEGMTRHGLLGAPVMVALREFTETRDGRLLVPASPRTGPVVENMCFFGFTPVVEVLYRGAGLPFIFDSGSAETFLHPPFFRRFRGEINNRSKGKTIVLAGVGDRKIVRARVVDELDFEAGGLSLSLKRVSVHEQVTNNCSGLFFGTLGLDLLGQCERITLNFESMSCILR